MLRSSVSCKSSKVIVAHSKNVHACWKRAWKRAKTDVIDTDTNTTDDTAHYCTPVLLLQQLLSVFATAAGATTADTTGESLCNCILMYTMMSTALHNDCCCSSKH
eukprot:6966-Heterococcus_DN1.PRE.8